jgi:hypothetical protein
MEPLTCWLAIRDDAADMISKPDDAGGEVDPAMQRVGSYRAGVRCRDAEI